VAGAALLLCAAALPVGAAEAFDSPAEVRPLLLGSAVPSVDVLGLDGTAVDLKEVVGKRDVVLIFYRGGW